MPTSAHWYNEETLKDLIAGYLVKERNNGQHKKTVKEFISEFRGLSGTAKQKKIAADFQRADISIFQKDQDIDRDKLRQLLQSMKAESIAPKAQALGIIGEDHFKKSIFQREVIEHTFKYIKRTGIENGMPYILEIGFAVINNSMSSRKMFVGLNWSPVIGTSMDQTIRTAIQDNRIDTYDQVVLLVHIARPRFEFTDKGKTSIDLSNCPGLRNDITAGIAKAAKIWKAVKRRADKENRVSENQHRQLKKEPETKIKEIAFSVMEQAYKKASGDGRYYANARQIMYAARPEILKQYSKELSDNFDVYFTQTLLKDYIETYSPDWKIVWDARGHFTEPHTGKKIGLGGIEVEKYINNWSNRISIETPDVAQLIDTKGPEHRFRNILFVEKEGFTEILQDAGFMQRYDMALMSTKGVSVKAACDLVYKIKGSFSEAKIFVLHDFDLGGFKIFKSLEKGVRLSFGTEVIELGFRIKDIEGLAAERVVYEQSKDPRYYLNDCGATPEEYNFLVTDHYNKRHEGRRVELNAMTSVQLIRWLDKKLVELGATKYIPEQEIINESFRHIKKMIHIEGYINQAVEIWDGCTPPDIPEGLNERIKAKFKEDPGQSWDQALRQIIQKEDI